jgi:hypothetical protein
MGATWRIVRRYRYHVVCKGVVVLPYSVITRYALCSHSARVPGVRKTPKGGGTYKGSVHALSQNRIKVRMDNGAEV